MAKFTKQDFEIYKAEQELELKKMEKRLTQAKQALADAKAAVKQQKEHIDSVTFDEFVEQEKAKQAAEFKIPRPPIGDDDRSRPWEPPVRNPDRGPWLETPPNLITFPEPLDKRRGKTVRFQAAGEADAAA